MICLKDHLVCIFCFPNSDHAIFSMEFAFFHYLYIHMHVDARGCTWMHVDVRGCTWMHVDARA